MSRVIARGEASLPSFHMVANHRADGIRSYTFSTALSVAVEISPKRKHQQPTAARVSASLARVASL